MAGDDAAATLSKLFDTRTTEAIEAARAAAKRAGDAPARGQPSFGRKHRIVRSRDAAITELRQAIAKLIGELGRRTMTAQELDAVEQLGSAAIKRLHRETRTFVGELDTDDAAYRQHEAQCLQDLASFIAAKRSNLRPQPARRSQRVTRVYEGRASGPVPWESLVRVFDGVFGAENHELPSFPDTIGGFSVAWIDADGVRYEVDRLEDLEGPYVRAETAQIVMSKNLTETSVLYSPARAAVRASVQAVDVAEAELRVDAVRAEFPIVDRVIFISHSVADASLATLVQTALQARVDPGVRVFLSSQSIKAGDDRPLELIFADLLEAKGVAVLLTPTSIRSAWVWWEGGAAWARQAVVVPLFAGIRPSDVAGPITYLKQGADVGRRDQLDDALSALVRAVGPPAPAAPLTDEEFDAIARALGETVKNDRG